MAYHNGSVWPHDNALIAHGLARYGLAEKALQIWTGLFEAGMYFRPAPDAGAVLRLCPRARRGAGPLPGGLRPAGLVGGLGVPALSGLPGPGDQRPRGCKSRFTRPHLPASLGELRIHNLEVAGATVDLLLVRHEHDVGVNVLRRDGDVQIMVVK